MGWNGVSQTVKATGQLVLVSTVAFLSFLLLYASLFYMWAYSMWRNQWDFMFGAAGLVLSLFFVAYFIFVLYALISKYLLVKKMLKN
jgi:hypothetical protein